MDLELLYILLPLVFGWLLDRLIGDPNWLPHPVVMMGYIISKGERTFNKGLYRMVKGGTFALILIVGSFFLIKFILKYGEQVSPYVSIPFSVIIIFYCLAGKTLITEVRNVFVALDLSLESGRKQVARIVGRDTNSLSDQQIRIASLETLSENLSDGVVAPLFWYLLLGIPGMFAYKMVNTLDSMIGYKNERYKDFGCFAARIDDIANYIPARLTALLMIVVSGRLSLLTFVDKYGSNHASPNSGYPEAALAGILDCRFGGPNSYFGKVVDKPYIGKKNRLLTSDDMEKAIQINFQTEILMILLILIIKTIIYYSYY